MIDMLPQFIYRKHRRAVSPVIATVLVIALALAAGAVVATLLNNLNQGSLAFDNENSIGSAGATSFKAPTIDVTGVNFAPQDDTAIENLDPYSRITVEITNPNSEPLYVFDIDVIVFGVKLDEIKSWEISSAGSAPYGQAAGTTEDYDVILSDVSVTSAKIPLNSSFVYEVLYGSSRNTISGTVQKEKLAELSYSPKFADIGIFHRGSSFGPNDAAGQYEGTLRAMNGSNNMYIKYSRANDAYDYLNNPASIVPNDILGLYDVIIIDSWAVPQAISGIINTLHNNGMKMIFYGSVSTFGGSLAAIQAEIDSTSTQNILGITPSSFTGNPTDVDVTEHSYQFTTGSSVVNGLGGVVFEELEDNTYSGNTGDNQSPGICGNGDVGTGVGDRYGYDIATFDGNFSSYNQYGTTYFEFSQDQGGLVTMGGYPATGTLLTEKFNSSDLNNETLAYSFIWKHSNALGTPDANLVDKSQLSQVRINMIGGAIGESSRVFIQTTKATVETFDLYVKNNNQDFDITIGGTIESKDVINGSLSFSIDMPDLEFRDCNPSFGSPSQNEFGTFSIESNPVVQDEIVVKIESGNVVNIDISNYYGGDILKGETYKLELGVPGAFLFGIGKDATTQQPLSWTVQTKTGSGNVESETFSRAIDSGTDTIAPDQVTGLTSPSKTETTIDLSWNAASDNGGGFVETYTIYRNGGFLANVSAPTTSYTDTGLNSQTTYTYEVSAVDDSGLEGVKSDPLSVTTNPSNPPPDVTGLTALVQSSSRIDLNWDNITNVDGYRIYREISGGSRQLINTLTNGSSFYNDSGLQASTTYTYEVYAWNNSKESLNPATVTETTAAGGSTKDMYASAISVSYIRDSGNQYFVDVTVTVLNATDDAAISGVIVSLEADLDGSISTAQGVTGASGQVTIRLVETASRNQPVTITITDLAKNNYNWDNTLGQTGLSDPDGPPTGASI